MTKTLNKGKKNVKINKIREVLFDKTEYINGNVTLCYGKAKSVYIKMEAGGIEEQQYSFVLDDVVFISTNRNNERCYCDIRLSNGIVISVYGTYEEVSFYTVTYIHIGLNIKKARMV